MRKGARIRLGLRIVERLGTVGPAAGGVRGGQSFVHDPADGADAPPALGAAAEAAIDLTGGPRRFVAGERRADVVVGQHIAGANDHRDTTRRSIGSTRNYLRPSKIDFNQKTLLFSYSNLLGSQAIPLRATLMRALATKCLWAPVFSANGHGRGNARRRQASAAVSSESSSRRRRRRGAAGIAAPEWRTDRRSSRQSAGRAPSARSSAAMVRA